MRRLAPRLGIRRGFTVDGVYFKELSALTPEVAFSHGGPGFKDYRVTFPDGRKQVIRCTPHRVFPDVAPVPLIQRALRRVEAIAPLVRPGGRLVELSAGDGLIALRLADLIGRAGAVVSLSHDAHAVEFTVRRFAHPHPGKTANISFEHDPLSALLGEPAGGFDGAVALDALAESAADRREALVRELWRVVAPGGWLFLSERPGGTALLTPEHVTDLAARVTGAIDARRFSDTGPDKARFVASVRGSPAQDQPNIGPSHDADDDQREFIAAPGCFELVVFKGLPAP